MRGTISKGGSNNRWLQREVGAAEGRVAVYKQLDEDGQVDFKGKSKVFARTYDFLASILPYTNADWEKLLRGCEFATSRPFSPSASQSGSSHPCSEGSRSRLVDCSLSRNFFRFEKWDCPLSLSKPLRRRLPPKLLPACIRPQRGARCTFVPTKKRLAQL